MIAVDTNLWARAILGDDPKQSPAARKAIEQAASGSGIFVPLLVFVKNHQPGDTRGRELVQTVFWKDRVLDKNHV